MHISRALTASEVVSALIEFRLLKRKCGFTCAFSARNSASRARTLALHDAGFGLARGFDRQQDVVKPDRQQVEKDAGAEDQRVILREPRVDAMKFVKAGEHAAEDPGGEKPNAAGNRGSNHVGEEESRDGRALQRRGHARIPRREADERVEQAEHERDGGGFEPRQIAGNCQQIREHPRERNPAKEVEEQAAQLGENGMHTAISS